MLNNHITRPKGGLYKIALASLALLVLVFGGVATALAVGLDLDGPTTTEGTWTKNQGCGGCGPFDTMEVFIIGDTGAGPFQNDSTFGFNDASWSGTLVNPLYSLSTGNDVNSLNWTFDFAGDINNTITFDFLIWDGGVFADLTFAATFQYINGSIANINQRFEPPYPFLTFPDGVGYDRSPVPEPSTMLVLGSGLAGLGFFRRRKKAA